MAFLACTSRYLPAKIVRNCDLTQFPEPLRELILTKAGIRTRRIAEDHECTSDLGVQAVNKLLNKAELLPNQIDGLICVTSSPDRMLPATATRIQNLCGLNCFAFDVNSVCSGGIYALRVASALIHDGLQNIVVVASEVYSKILNRDDLSTFPYFGDGAAACLVSSKGPYLLADFRLYSDGSGADFIQVPGGGTMLPASQTEDESQHYFRMIGRKVYEFATLRGSEIIAELLARNSIMPDRIITHQANLNVILEIARRTGLPREKFFINVDKYANTAGASVLIALDELLESGEDCNSIVLCAFGGGLSWGGAMLQRK